MGYLCSRLSHKILIYVTEHVKEMKSLIHLLDCWERSNLGGLLELLIDEED